MLEVTGGAAAAGALIGTGIGAVAGIGIAEATIASVTIAGAAAGADEACGGDMCAGEIQDASQALQDDAPEIENTAENTFSDISQAGASSKAPIIGEPQVTSDPFHASEFKALAEEFSQQSSSQSVYLNRTINTITGGQVSSNLRPDVAVANSDGSYSFVEIVSQSQSIISQVQKMNDMAELLSEYGITLAAGHVIPNSY